MASLQGDMCPQKYYSITKSQNRCFVLKNAENEAHAEHAQYHVDIDLNQSNIVKL